VRFAADALGVVRLVVALGFPSALARAAAAPAGGWTPLALFLLAAATDFLDGRVARRAGRPTPHGAVLDIVADVAFVLAGTGTGAALGLVSWAVPVAIVLAIGSYAAASLSQSALARSRAGHAAGVANYALVGLVGGSVALPGRAWPWILGLGGAGVAGLNLAAVLERVVQGVRRARARRDGGRRARSAHS
jgi:phosphatidylglycerophosphate synthase